MIIGITGGIGSGKSSFARILADRGASLIDADKIGHEILERADVRRALVNSFGREIVDAEGRVDRGELGRRTFATAENLKTLNDIVHPPLVVEFKKQIREAAASGAGQKVIVDAALIYEWGDVELFDCIVVVEAGEEERLQRIRARTGLNSKEIRRRMAAQMPLAEKAARADIVVQNNGSVEDLEAVADRLWRQWVADAENSGEESQ